ncbi:MAG: hypothetical protein EOP88_13110 [Verrucomicrobiaceae bacterium]|nr:MAG: hypothetical protein EOP88_13110 [Verrucomicrobiaceae bacterium]
MKAPLLPIATAVLGIAVGFIGGKSGGAGGAGDTASKDGQEQNESGKRQGSSRGAGSGGQRSDSSADAVLSNLLKGRAASEITAEEAYQLMLPQLNMDWNADPLQSARMNYQFQLLMSKLPLPVLEEVLVLSRDGKSVPPYRASMLFGAYATRNWEKAMAWAETQPDAPVLRSAALSRLATTDPARAAELYQKDLMSGESRSGMWDTSYTLGSAYAKQGQAEFFKFIDGLPSGSVSNLLSNAARNLPKEDIPAFLAEMQKRSAEGKVESWTMNNLMSNMATTHPEEARKWLDSLEPGTKRAEAELSLANSLARQGKSTEITALLKSAMEGAAGKEKEFVRERAANTLMQNPAVMAELVAMLPAGQELTKEDVKHWGNYGYGRTDAIVDVAGYIHSQDEKAAYLIESLNGMGENSRGNRKPNAKDFEILEHRLQKAGLTPEGMTQVRTALQGARDKILAK